MSIKNFLDPIEINSLKTSSFLSKSMFNNKDTFILLLFEDILLLKLIIPNQNKIIPRFTRLGEQELTSKYLNNSLALSDDDKFAFVGNDKDGIDVLNLNDIETSSFPLLNSCNNVKNINRIVYNDDKIYTNNLNSIYILSLEKDYSCKILNNQTFQNLYDFALSNNKSNLFLVAKDYFISLESISLNIILNITLNNSDDVIPNKICSTKDDKTVFIGLGLDGVILINLETLNITKFNLDAEITDISLFYLKDKTYLLFTSVLGLKIYQFINDNLLLINDFIMDYNTKGLIPLI